MTEKLSEQFQKLQTETRAMLQKRDMAGLSMATIANESHIPLGWLQVFQRGVSEQSRIERVEELNEYLKSKGVTI